MSEAQLELQPKPKREVDLDGRVDEKRNIHYLGSATQMFDGTWRCLANVDGYLCLVEVSLTDKDGRPL